MSTLTFCQTLADLQGACLELVENPVELVAIEYFLELDTPISTPKSPHNNTLHTEPRAARLLETMMFAAAR